MTLSAAKAASKIRSALESGQLCFTYRTSSLLAGTRHPTIDVVNANEMTLFAYLAASHILVLVAYGTPSFRHYLLPREANLDVALQMEPSDIRACREKGEGPSKSTPTL